MVSQEALALLQFVSKAETVRGNYEGFTKNDAGKAISACKAQAKIGSTSEEEFKEMVRIFSLP